MSAIIGIIVKIVLLVVGLGIVLGILLRLGLFAILRANGCYGFVTFGFTLFSTLGVLLHKNLTGVAAWGAIPWLLAILFGALPMLLWGVVAIVRSKSSKIRTASVVFLITAMIVPLWVVLEIATGV